MKQRERWRRIAALDGSMVAEYAGFVLLAAVLFLFSHPGDAPMAGAFLVCSALACSLRGASRGGSLLTLFLLGAGLLLGAGAHQDALLLVAALTLVVLLEPMVLRLVALASAIVVMAGGNLSGLAMLCLGGAVASAIDRRALRVSAVAAGGIIGLALLGLPLASGPVRRTAVSSSRDGCLVWDTREALYLSSAEIEYRLPPADPEHGGSGRVFTVDLEMGGLRESVPAALVVAGDRVLATGDGEATIPLEDSDLTITIRMDLPFRPFRHPVLYAGPARLVMTGVEDDED